MFFPSYIFFFIHFCILFPSCPCLLKLYSPQFVGVPGTLACTYENGCTTGCIWPVLWCRCTARQPLSGRRTATVAGWLLLVQQLSCLQPAVAMPAAPRFSLQHSNWWVSHYSHVKKWQVKREALCFDQRVDILWELSSHVMPGVVVD